MARKGTRHKRHGTKRHGTKRHGTKKRHAGGAFRPLFAGDDTVGAPISEGLSDAEIRDALREAYIPREKHAELIPQLRKLRLPVPDNYRSQFYNSSYADRKDAAEDAYRAAMERASADAAAEEGRPCTRLRKRERKEFYENLARDQRRQALASAEAYRSDDLVDYADALLIDWKKDGGLNAELPLV